MNALLQSQSMLQSAIAVEPHALFTHAMHAPLLLQTLSVPQDPPSSMGVCVSLQTAVPPEQVSLPL